MNDGTHEQLVTSVEGLHELARWISGDRDEDTTAQILEDYGYPGDYEDPEHYADNAIREAVLCIDTEITKSVVFGTGGPHTEIEITFSEGMEPLRGRAVGYWGGDKVERHISSDDAETIAEYFGLTQ